MVIHQRSIVATLGLRKTAALPVFHALSGANNTSSKGYLLEEFFQNSSEGTINALTNLDTNEKPSEETLAGI